MHITNTKGLAFGDLKIFDNFEILDIIFLLFTSITSLTWVNTWNVPAAKEILSIKFFCSETYSFSDAALLMGSNTSISIKRGLLYFWVASLIIFFPIINKKTIKRYWYSVKKIVLKSCLFMRFLCNGFTRKVRNTFYVFLPFKTVHA